MPSDTMPTGPAVIDPHALLTVDQAAAILRTSKRGVLSACRYDGLRHAKRLNRVWITGAWLAEWIEGGERRTEARAHREAS